jgi:hypothetical protein
MMYTATINFQTRIKSDGVRFPLVEFNPNVPGVSKAEIEAPNGHEIHGTIHLTAVASLNEARALAAEVHRVALDRIVFNHGIAIENPRRTSEQYSPPGAVDAFSDVGTRVGVVLGIDPAQLKDELERPSPPGEGNYGLFRSARQSLGHVEEFMHLYHILLMLCNQQYQEEKQKRVEDFIKNQDPNVQQKPDPRDPKVMETVYTRLRNKLGHKRAGVNLEDTKREMGHWLPGLIALTQRAIISHG